VAVRTQRYALLYLRVGLLVTTNASQTTNLALLGGRIRMMKVNSPRMRKATLSALQRSLVLVPRISIALARILGVGLVTLLVLLVPSQVVRLALAADNRIFIRLVEISELWRSLVSFNQIRKRIYTMRPLSIIISPKKICKAL
jgi:hypothetical protein